MVTYSAKATASASVVAQFFFRHAETVTATASATAESNISEEDAYNIALSIAQENANSAAQNDANVLIQSVNTSTLGDNTLFLDSSLLVDFLEKVGDNEYNLTQDLELAPFRLIIGKNETLNISGKKLQSLSTNFGTINVTNGGVLSIGKTSKSSLSKTIKNKIFEKASSNTNTDDSSSNNGTITTVGSDTYITGTYTNNAPISVSDGTLYIGTDSNGDGVSTIFTNNNNINATYSTTSTSINIGTNDTNNSISTSFTNNYNIIAKGSTITIGNKNSTVVSTTTFTNNYNSLYTGINLNLITVNSVNYYSYFYFYGLKLYYGLIDTTVIPTDYYNANIEFEPNSNYIETITQYGPIYQNFQYNTPIIGKIYTGTTYIYYFYQS